MYGLPYEITALREVGVFRPGEDRLQQLYKFNVNGQLYFDGMDFKLRREDRIALLVPVTGG
jgi:molybdopterin converting factor small subunit